MCAPRAGTGVRGTPAHGPQKPGTCSGPWYASADAQAARAGGEAGASSAHVALGGSGARGTPAQGPQKPDARPAGGREDGGHFIIPDCGIKTAMADLAGLGRAEPSNGEWGAPWPQQAGQGAISSRCICLLRGRGRSGRGALPGTRWRTCARLSPKAVSRPVRARPARSVHPAGPPDGGPVQAAGCLNRPVVRGWLWRLPGHRRRRFRPGLVCGGRRAARGWLHRAGWCSRGSPRSR